MGCYLVPVTISNRTVRHQFCATYVLCLSFEIVCTFKTNICNCLPFVTFYTPEGCSLHSRLNPQTAFQMVARCPSINSSRKLSRMFKRLRNAVILSFILLTLKNNQIIITQDFIFEEMLLIAHLPLSQNFREYLTDIAFDIIMIKGTPLIIRVFPLWSDRNDTRHGHTDKA